MKMENDFFQNFLDFLIDKFITYRTEGNRMKWQKGLDKISYNYISMDTLIRYTLDSCEQNR